MSTLLKSFGLLFAALLFLYLPARLAFPAISSLRYLEPGLTVTMITRPSVVQQTFVPLSRMALPLQRAVVEAEDGNFFRHDGIDFREMQSSFLKNWKKKGYRRGFSTITMQLAKNLYLPSYKSLTRKAVEIVLALEMERELPKERILELYLNVVEWGKGIYGAEAAARHYFKKSASTLTFEESAFLASILPNPRKWGCWPPGPHVRKRQRAILARMGFGATPFSKRDPEIPELPEEGSEPEAVSPQESSPAKWERQPESLPWEGL